MSFKVATRAGRRVYKGAPPKPLADGACPHCFRVIQLTARLRRREHIDPATGVRCTGSGITVGDNEHIEVGELPPIPIPERAADAHVGWSASHSSYVLTADGSFERYAGRSDREAAHGRVACPACARHIPLNSDGSTRRHRVRHQDPLAPYCGGAQ